MSSMASTSESSDAMSTVNSSKYLTQCILLGTPPTRIEWSISNDNGDEETDFFQFTPEYKLPHALLLRTQQVFVPSDLYSRIFMLFQVLNNFLHLATHLTFSLPNNDTIQSVLLNFALPLFTSNPCYTPPSLPLTPASLHTETSRLRTLITTLALQAYTSTHGFVLAVPDLTHFLAMDLGITSAEVAGTDTESADFTAFCVPGYATRLVAAFRAQAGYCGYGDGGKANDDADAEEEFVRAHPVLGLSRWVRGEGGEFCLPGDEESARVAAEGVEGGVRVVGMAAAFGVGFEQERKDGGGDPEREIVEGLENVVLKDGGVPERELVKGLKKVVLKDDDDDADMLEELEKDDRTVAAEVVAAASPVELEGWEVDEIINWLRNERMEAR